MLVPNQLIEVKVIGVTLKHYRDLGYDVNMFDTIMVPPEHLTTGSHSSVYVICDVCGENIVREYKEYLLHHKEGYDTCNKCKKKKATNTCLLKYGVSEYMMVPEIQQKHKNTILNKYGVENISQSEQIKDKKKKTCMQNYGVENPMFVESIKHKIEETNMNRYGCKNPMQNQEIKDKTTTTNIKKYGVKNPLQNQEIKMKSLQTMYKNNNTPASSQQIQLHKMIQKKYPNAVLNYPYSVCSLDIFVCVNGINIDVEYDGWYFHQDKQRDIKRDKFLQSEGFKTLRIRSGHLLPEEQELFDAIDYLVNTEHHFKEIILSDWEEDDKNESLLDSTAV